MSHVTDNRWATAGGGGEETNPTNPATSQILTHNLELLVVFFDKKVVLDTFK